MSIPTLPCPKCGNKIWQGPRYVPPTGTVTTPVGVKIGDCHDWLSYTCTDCRFVRYEAPLDRQEYKKGPVALACEKYGLPWKVEGE